MGNPSAPRKSSNYVQTIERVSLILEMVGQNSQGIGITELSVGLNLPKGTVHRILSSLSQYGLIRQDGKSKNYFLGLKLMEFGTLVGTQLDLRKVAEPILRELAEKTKETVHMVVLDRNEVVYIDKIEKQQDTGGLKMASRLGSRNPVHSCAVGKAILSHYTEDALDEILGKKEFPRRTANTITDPRCFKEHLRTVRSRGYAVDDEENERGIRCLAAPIFDEKGRPVAAISISGPAFRVTKKAIQDVMKKEVMSAAAEISRRLGYQETDRNSGK